MLYRFLIGFLTLIDTHYIHFAIHSCSVGLPELVLPTIMALRRYVKPS